MTQQLNPPMPPTNPYLTLFTDYVVEGTRTLLEQLRRLDGQMEDAQRIQAWHLLSYALDLHSAWPVTRALLLLLAPRMERAGYRQEWLPYLERGLLTSQTLDDAETEALLTLHISHLRQRLGQMEQARQDVTRALALFSAGGDRRRQGVALSRLAEISREQGDLVRADDAADQALALLAEDAQERAFASLTKGRIAFDRHQFPQARHFFQAALTLCEKTGDSRRLGVCIQNLGRVHAEEEHYDLATQHYEQAIALLDAANDPFNRAVVQMNLGIIHSLCDRPEQALAAYAQAEVIFRRLQDSTSLARLANNQGVELQNLGRWSEAEALFCHAAAFWLELGNLPQYVIAMDNLVETYLAQELFAQALDICEQVGRHLTKQPSASLAPAVREQLAQHCAQAQRGLAGQVA